ncbi:conserved Plasmodium protein, unknown function [Plasmodium gallinaceum]|uniref:Uncharacterized protein n=1 Tax=Plasmodium gallinaceum TaxID=5849 RepID=A0A1J1GUT2_PLAGA|nr:conserved Plasmodium protein, unknown function [Plasmodium gallinaceum]CRG96271.1 conserved Plasmodium protein, unknown function [Plasmodium gallinaceum]
MIGTFECISIVIISLFFIKIYKHFNKKKIGKDDLTIGKHGTVSLSSNLKVDIICDITNNFGKYYAKEAIKKKNIVCIIPVHKNYNKEYENVDNFNEFMAEFFKFLDIKNGKLILASENNCLNDYLHITPEYEDDDQIILASCIINKNISIIVCVINYDKDIENQLDYYLKNKKIDFCAVINNLFLNNINYSRDENIEVIGEKCSFIPNGEFNDLFNFFGFMNVKKEFLLDLYSIILINTKNYMYFYKILGNLNSGTFLNAHIYDNLTYSNIYNSLMDIHHNLICEKAKKDKKIQVKKFYTFCCLKCDYKKIVKFTLMKLENNLFLFYFYNIYSYFYCQLVLYFVGKK